MRWTWMVYTLIVSVTSLSVLQQPLQAGLVPAQEMTAAPVLDRQADMATIQKTLESKMLRQRLHAMGLSDAEIQSRLANMSDQEVHQFASQIRSVNSAGWVVGVLIAVLLVVLIIYLIKRI